MKQLKAVVEWILFTATALSMITIYTFVIGNLMP